jgi:hypothetical protein
MGISVNKKSVAEVELSLGNGKCWGLVWYLALFYHLSTSNVLFCCYARFKQLGQWVLTNIGWYTSVLFTTLPYDMQTNTVSSSLVWQYWIVLVSTDWYSFVSLCQLKELWTHFVTPQYRSILLSTSQYTLVLFYTRCYMSSLQHDA